MATLFCSFPVRAWSVSPRLHSGPNLWFALTHRTQWKTPERSCIFCLHFPGTSLPSWEEAKWSFLRLKNFLERRSSSSSPSWAQAQPALQPNPTQLNSCTISKSTSRPTQRAVRNPSQSHSGCLVGKCWITNEPTILTSLPFGTHTHQHTDSNNKLCEA